MELKEMKNTGKDIDLQLTIYSLVEAICVGFNVDRNTAIDVVNEAMRDERLNILEIISEIFALNNNESV